jgi:predicted nucleic acid-binding protein
MNIEGPVEVVFDTSVIIGAILESLGLEAGGASRNALIVLIQRRYHILQISEQIRIECKDDLVKRGLPPHYLLDFLRRLLEPSEKIKSCRYRSEDINLKVSVPEHDRHVAEAALAVKGKRKKLAVCLVTKNTRHFPPEEMRRYHEIVVLTPEEYIDP